MCDYQEFGSCLRCKEVNDKIVSDVIADAVSSLQDGDIFEIRAHKNNIAWYSIYEDNFQRKDRKLFDFNVDTAINFDSYDLIAVMRV